MDLILLKITCILAMIYLVFTIVAAIYDHSHSKYRGNVILAYILYSIGFGIYIFIRLITLFI